MIKYGRSNDILERMEWCFPVFFHFSFRILNLLRRKCFFCFLFSYRIIFIFPVICDNFSLATLLVVFLARMVVSFVG